MADKYLMLNLDDEKSGKIAEVLSNKTCKRILGLIADDELSQKDISLKLKIPLNTVDYNIKKLLFADLVEKTPRFFWSVKGKRIETYRLTNKKILISTRSTFSGMMASILFGGFVFAGIKTYFYYSSKLFISPAELQSTNLAYSMAPKLADSQVSMINPLFPNIVVWILVGALVGLVFFKLYRKLKGGKF